MEGVKEEVMVGIWFTAGYCIEDIYKRLIKKVKG